TLEFTWLPRRRKPDSGALMHLSARCWATLAAILLGTLGTACASTSPPGPPTEDRYLVMISFDGFRADYLDRGITPTLDSLARAGIRADSLIPTQPTKTFPNHYSIAT